MDAIFRKTKNIFTVVSTAKHEPRRYGKNGELLIDYADTDEYHRRASQADTRRASLAASGTIRNDSSGGHNEKKDIVQKENV